MPPAGWQTAVLSFWFDELSSADWFVQSDAVDSAVVSRFRSTHEAVSGLSTGALVDDIPTARAAIVVLDQFPRNMFRHDGRSFATDAKALEIAKIVVERGGDIGLSTDERLFVYLPFEHSESLTDQDTSVGLFEALGHDRYLEFAKNHRDVIKRFGRFPHRNRVLGRTSTPEEMSFIEKNGRGF